MPVLPVRDFLTILALIGFGFATHFAMTAPSSAKRSEQERIHRKGRKDTITNLLWTIPPSKFAVWTWTVCGAVVVLANHIPGIAPAASLMCFTGGAVSRLTFSTPYLIGLGLSISGSALRKWCFHELGRHFTFELAVRNNHKLVTTGPYSVVRHPSYSGHIAYCLGSVLCLFGCGSWVQECGVLETMVGKVFALLWTANSTLIVVALTRRAALEDEALRKVFGEEWLVYADRTRYRIFPQLY